MANKLLSLSPRTPRWSTFPGTIQRWFMAIPLTHIPPCTMRPQHITAPEEPWRSAPVLRWAPHWVATGVMDAIGGTAITTSTTTTNTKTIRTGTKPSTTATALLNSQPAARGSIIHNIAEVLLTQIGELRTGMLRGLEFSPAPRELIVHLTEVHSARTILE